MDSIFDEDVVPSLSSSVIMEESDQVEKVRINFK